jgi:outer membrane protein, multidrug efflux system
MEEQQLPQIEDLPPAGLPAQLLENRPDILAALARLKAADQQLVAAEAARLPAIRLTGSGGYSGGELDRLFDNWLANLAAGLTAPLLDGGRRAAEVDLSASVVEERLALYRQTVLNAVREVEDSLAREVYLREHIHWSESQLRIAAKALDEARSRYLNGLSDYLPVLTQLLSVQNLEMDLIERRRELIAARITLHRALGGSWPQKLPPPGTSSLANTLEKQ